MLLKLSRNKKNLNDVAAAPFMVSFSQLPTAKNTENRATVTSLRSFFDFMITLTRIKTQSVDSALNSSKIID